MIKQIIHSIFVSEIIALATSTASSPALINEKEVIEEVNDETEKYHILDNNLQEEERENLVEVDLNPAAPDHEVVVLEPWWETEYMGVAVGVLVTVIFVLITIIIFILYKNYKTNPYPTNSTYYETQIPKFDHPESHWPDRKLTIGRKLPPTPTTSEEHYTDSSMEYSSPLLTNNCRQQIYAETKPQPDINWESFFPTPPAGTPPRGSRGSLNTARSVYMKPVSHYAATDVINPGTKTYSKSGLTYFL